MKEDAFLCAHYSANAEVFNVFLTFKDKSEPLDDILFSMKISERCELAAVFLDYFKNDMTPE